MEILYNGIWGSVCDDGWDLNEAMVVCRQLDYSTAVGAPTSAYFGESTGPILLDQVSFHCAFFCYKITRLKEGSLRGNLVFLLYTMDNLTSFPCVMLQQEQPF